MNVNPKSLKKLWEKQKQQNKTTSDLLNRMEDKDKELNKPTDYVNQMNVSVNDVPMDSDLHGMGGSSLGVGLPNTGTSTGRHVSE